MPRAKNGSLTKIGVVWQKMDFWTKNRDFGPKKKHTLLGISHVLATTGKSCSKKKVAFSQMNNMNQSLRKFWVIFWVRTHFSPKNHISAECKNVRFSAIPAQTGSIVILGHFFMARTVPPSFVENGPKLRVLIPLN